MPALTLGARSGGQKQRVSLARAAYCSPDVLLCDSPLSALDAHTAKEVFSRLLGPEGLLKRAARLLVTHSTHLLARADRVAVVHNGTVPFVGPYAALAAAGAAHASEEDAAAAARRGDDGDGDAADGHDDDAAAAHGGAGDRQSLRSLFEMLQAAAQDDGAERARRAASTASDASGGALSPREGVSGGASPLGGAAAAVEVEVAGRRVRSLSSSSMNGHDWSSGAATEAALQQEEERATGNVDGRVYGQYLTAAGGCAWVCLLVSVMVAERVVYSGADWWLATWTGAEEVAAAANRTDAAFSKAEPPFGLPRAEDDGSARFYLDGYLAIVVLNSALIGSRMALVVACGVSATRRLFEQLLWAVLRSPMLLFETTPLGRLMNRFSFDTDTIDFVLVSKINEAVVSMLWLVAGAASVSVATPWVLVLLLPLAVAYFRLQQYYRSSSRELQRLDSTTRSPVQAHFSESLQGASTIRAYGDAQVARFTRESDARVDENSRMVLAYAAVGRWLGVRTELMGALVTLATALLCWVARDSITGGLAGFALTWAYNLTLSLQFVVLGVTDAEARFVSVERVTHYVNTLQPEAALDSAADARPPRGWPSRGRIEFKDVVLRYRPALPPALRGLSAVIEGGERVAIVGRTGAGKSTICAALFRLVELEAGSIAVDGVDLATLGLADVRGALHGITVIPQDPQLLSGALRDALDPFGESDDAAVWSALDAVRMGGAVRALQGLETPVADGGVNWSVGERQLLCLARALLRRPRVLVLDEATASVDDDTDAFIQETVRRSFAGATLLIVAHRLGTVMDADRVMVLDAGEVVEMDAPQRLLDDRDSVFSGIVDAGGPAAAAKLRALAAAAAETKASRGE